VVSVDVAAVRLGSPLDPIVEIQDAQGRRQATEEIRVGSDPELTFRVPVSGEYRLLVANLNFQGGPQYVYRITISSSPYVLFAFPPGGQAGKAAAVELFSLAGGGVLRNLREAVTFPAGAPAEFDLSGATRTANAVALE